MKLIGLINTYHNKTRLDYYMNTVKLNINQDTSRISYNTNTCTHVHKCVFHKITTSYNWIVEKKLKIQIIGEDAWV